MSDNKGKIPYDPQDSLMDTQRLLLGLEPMEGAEFSLEDILAEYGSSASAGTDKTPEDLRTDASDIKMEQAVQ